MVFAVHERSAWKVAEQLHVDEWAERHRMLGPDESARPGLWKNETAPYMREPMRALTDPQFSMVGVKSGAQVSKSETGRNWIGRNIDVDPGPSMIVFPTQDAATEVVEERLMPMISNCPRLSQYKTGRSWDLKKRQIKLVNCRIYVAWASSAQSLASRPVRYLFLDEVDKYSDTPSPGREGDPITLALLRLTSYRRRAKTYMASTPTNKYGPIHRFWENSADRRYCYVPCPHCEFWQRLTWDRIRFNDRGSTDLEVWRSIRNEAELGIRDVHYQCARCGGRIAEKHKPQMVRQCRWRSEGCEFGEHPNSSTVAFQVSSLYSLFVSWEKIVAEHFDARLKGMTELHAWTNGRLGETSESDGVAVTEERVNELAARGHPSGVIPPWATAVVATADTQRGGWWWVTRAHGHNGKSRILGWGWAITLDELRALALDTTYPIEGISHVRARSDVLVIDIQGGYDKRNEDASIADKLIAFAATDPERIKLIRGHGGDYRANRRLVKTASSLEMPPEVEMYTLCTQTYKDVLSDRINPQEGDPERWELAPLAMRPALGCDGPHPSYARQLCSEHKIAVRKGPRTYMVWQQKAAGNANHVWDCETYQLAGADLLRVDERPLLSAVAEAHIKQEDEFTDAATWWNGAR